MKLFSKYFILFLILNSHCFGCDSIEELRTKFHIENQVLTTAKGEKFALYPFESKLHFDLAYTLKDLEMARQIYQAYKIHLLPIFTESSEENTTYDIFNKFSQALIEICHYFGSPTFSPFQALIVALHSQELTKWTETNEIVLKAFINDASRPLYFSSKKEITAPFTIVIISTTCSGGNQSAALSISNLFELEPNIRTIIIDVEEIAQACDPVMIATNTYTYDMIYSNILQKTNDLSVIKKRKIFRREIENYIPNNLLHILKKEVISHSPDLIISTRSYSSDDISLATLGIDFRLFHPDYELCPSLCSYYRCIPSNAVRFWIPIYRPSLFKPLFRYMNREDLYDEHDDNSIFFEKLNQIIYTKNKNAEQSFEVIGYPCANFYEVKDKTVLKKKWNIASDEAAVFVVMGKHSTASMRDIFYNIKNTEFDKPLKCFFICGKNDFLKEELEKAATSSLIVCGLLNPQEMNEMMNVCSLGITKAGGATVSEVIATKTPLLLFDSYPWEEANGAFLEEIGLAKKVTLDLSLAKQIKNFLQDSGQLRYNRVDWRKKLFEKISYLMTSPTKSIGHWVGQGY